jgi:dTMP kinase
MFITFEGVEGCGKSTQLTRLREHLASLGHDVLVTREPGGTPIAEAIRGLLLDPANKAMTPTTELLLYEAARAQHVDERIRPALEAGMIVLCDRFADSTTAYQGAGRALPAELVANMHEAATRHTWPDLTIVLDVPADIGLERAGRAGGHDRIEQEPLAFHERVRAEFLRIAEAEPQRLRVVDGHRCVDEVARDIAALVEAALDKR